MQKETEKKLKYKKCKCRNTAKVEYEVFRHMNNHWGQGIVTKGLKMSVNFTRKACSIFSTRKKTTVLGTLHIRGEKLQFETWSFCGGLHL
jgi:hypothetical protein